jgi:hypothetical protein
MPQLNWWWILVPSTVLNLVLWYSAHTWGNRVLALIYSFALVLYIGRRLWHGVPDGYLTVTITDNADPRSVVVPKGTRFADGQGYMWVASTRTVRLPRWRVWWARWRKQELPRRFAVPVRRLAEKEQ